MEIMAIRDKVYANGKLVSESDGSTILGEVGVIYRSIRDGKVIFTNKQTYHNDLLINGAVFYSEKAGNVRSSFTPTPIDIELGIHTRDQIELTAETLPHERICGIMVGNGGCGELYNTVYKVNRTARSVPGMVPFRVVPVEEDLKAETRAQYILRVVKGDYAYYYGKRFDVEREINVEFEDGTVVPLDIDTLPTEKFVRVFTKYIATVDQHDIREYFKYSYGSTLRSLINSIGLISGYPGKDENGNLEFFNIRGITTANMENQELKDSESTISFVYKSYIV